MTTLRLLLVVFLAATSPLRLHANTEEFGEEPVMMTGTPEDSPRTRRIARAFEKDVKFGQLPYRINETVDALLRLGAYKLKRSGHKKEASQMIREWERDWNEEIIRISKSRGIGDHKPLVQWLSDKYRMMEFLLGKDICHSLRLDDLHTINHAIPVVISCIDNVSEDEFFLHFVDDYVNGYRGLGPVVVYWTSFFTCTGFSWGVGFLGCSPIAMGAEWITKGVVAPRLNRPLWSLACNK